MLRLYATIFVHWWNSCQIYLLMALIIFVLVEIGCVMALIWLNCKLKLY